MELRLQYLNNITQKTLSNNLGSVKSVRTAVHSVVNDNPFDFVNMFEFHLPPAGSSTMSMSARPAKIARMATTATRRLEVNTNGLNIVGNFVLLEASIVGC